MLPRQTVRTQGLRKPDHPLERGAGQRLVFGPRRPPPPHPHRRLGAQGRLIDDVGHRVVERTPRGLEVDGFEVEAAIVTWAEVGTRHMHLMLAAAIRTYGGKSYVIEPQVAGMFVEYEY